MCYESVPNVTYELNFKRFWDMFTLKIFEITWRMHLKIWKVLDFDKKSFHLEMEKSHKMIS